MARYALEHEEEQETKINPFERRLHAFGQVVLSSPTNCAYGMSFHEFSMFFQFAVSFFETFKSCFFKLSDASVMVQGLSTSVCLGHKLDLRRGAKQ